MILLFFRKLPELYIRELVEVVSFKMIVRRMLVIFQGKLLLRLIIGNHSKLFWKNVQRCLFGKDLHIVLGIYWKSLNQKLLFLGHQNQKISSLQIWERKRQ